MSAPTLDRYQMISFINQGTYGEVFIAIDRESLQEVAIKRLTDRAEGRNRLHNEIKANVILTGVKEVVQFQGHFKSTKGQHLVFEMAAGVDLFNMMERRNFKPIPERRVKKIARLVAAGLSEVHRRGVAHRDIKLENVSQPLRNPSNSHFRSW